MTSGKGTVIPPTDTNRHLTVRGVLRGGKTLELEEDTGLPEFLPDIPIKVHLELSLPAAVLHEGKSVVLPEAPPLPANLPDLPVTVQIEFPLPVNLLRLYGAWSDIPDGEYAEMEKELESMRRGGRRAGDEP